MLKKIVLAGGTGFIGQYLERTYTNEGYIVHIISRQPGQVSWNDEQAMVEALENAEMVINLAGKSVNCRYNEKNKREIYESRTRTTEALGKAIEKCQNPPKLWINSSTATIYRHAEDRPMTESTGELGTGFSVDVGKAWEDVFFSLQVAENPASCAAARHCTWSRWRRDGAIREFGAIWSWWQARRRQANVQLDPYRRRLPHH